MFNPNLKIQKSNKANKKDIQRFYKLNNYSARYIGYDHTYTVTLEDKIIGAVIISYQSDNNHYALLHALLIAPSHRNKGYAKQLILKVLNDHHHIICFAERGLERLYVNHGFSEEASNNLPDYLIRRYESYVNKNKELIVFISNKGFGINE